MEIGRQFINLNKGLEIFEPFSAYFSLHKTNNVQLTSIVDILPRFAKTQAQK